MRKFLIIMVLVASPEIAFLQTISNKGDTVFNKVDENGLKHGFWKKYYPNGNLNYSGFFKDDKPVGTLKRYYESGSLKAIMNFDSTGTYADTKLYYEDGQLAAEGYYYNSLKDSLWKYYSYYEGTIISDEIYKKGIKNGISHKYYPNGNVTEKTGWKDNVRSGVWEQYYEDGSLRIEGSYNHGKLTDNFIVYSPDGSLQIKGHYLEGKRHGRWIFYDEEENANFEVNFIYGKAENEEALTSKQQEYFQEMDKNIGRFKDPEPEDFLPLKNE
jgi:antitoxin component YwqK of YwqJK toxin-antitoxin module